MSSNTGAMLKSYIERIERLNAEISVLQSDRRDIYTEAKGNGFDVKALRALIRERASDPLEVENMQMLIDTYKAAIGQLDGTPLGSAMEPGK